MKTYSKHIRMAMEVQHIYMRYLLWVGMSVYVNWNKTPRNHIQRTNTVSSNPEDNNRETVCLCVCVCMWDRDRDGERKGKGDSEKESKMMWD